jgi:phosphohistidine phosphatase
MFIYFLRHGDASSDSHLRDSERPLTEIGKHQAATVGKFLRQTNARVDIILSSPLARAQETAALVHAHIVSPEPVSSEFLMNDSNQRQLLEQLNSLNVSTALLVGHAPHLSETISFLIHGNLEGDIEMKKCSLALVEALSPLRPGSGHLKQLTHVQTLMNKNTR